MLKEAKKAQGLSINAIILIVLGILVLVLLIVGFTLGWNRIFPFISPPSNVQDISDQCDLKCSMTAKFDYCSLPREVNLDRKTSDAVGLPQKISASCADLAQNPTLKNILGIKDCPGLCDPACKFTDVDPTPAGVQEGKLCLKKSDYATNVPKDKLPGTFRDENATHYCSDLKSCS
jgi:hypothetical protein